MRAGLANATAFHQQLSSYCYWSGLEEERINFEISKKEAELSQLFRVSALLRIESRSRKSTVTRRTIEHETRGR